LYAFDREVIPAGTQVSGMSALQPVSEMGENQSSAGVTSAAACRPDPFTSVLALTVADGTDTVES